MPATVESEVAAVSFVCIDERERGIMKLGLDRWSVCGVYTRPLT